MSGELELRSEFVVDVPLAGHTEADVYLSASTRQRLIDGQNKNTTRAYTRQWADFREWCDEHGRIFLPATPETLADYVGHLADENKAPASIVQAIATVRAAHRTAKYPKTPDTGGALLVLRQYRRQRAGGGKRNQRQAPPVTIEALRSMVGVCDLETAGGLRDRLTIVLGLALMGRRSELVALTIDDVNEVPDGLEVLIRMSKTDKDAEGELVAIPAGTHPLTNPVAAWREWMAILADNDITEGRLLRKVDRHGNIGDSLTDTSVNTILRKLAIKAGIDDAERYTAHSLRAGGATVAYAAGVPVSTIAKHGRWDPKSPVVLQYIRAVDIWKDNAMRNVGL